MHQSGSPQAPTPSGQVRVSVSQSAPSDLPVDSQPTRLHPPEGAPPIRDPFAKSCRRTTQIATHPRLALNRQYALPDPCQDDRFPPTEKTTPNDAAAASSTHFAASENRHSAWPCDAALEADALGIARTRRPGFFRCWGRSGIPSPVPRISREPYAARGGATRTEAANRFSKPVLYPLSYEGGGRVVPGRG